MYKATKKSGMSAQLPPPPPSSHTIELLRNIAKVRDRLAEKEKELEGKDQLIQDLTEKLREVREDRAFYKRILEDERATVQLRLVIRGIVELKPAPYHYPKKSLQPKQQPEPKPDPTRSQVCKANAQ
ncbi:hypothetical protein FRC00_013210, partial [Tulasnella sp. 408]